MLGLSVLFFLGIWIIITIVAMVIGSKFGRKPATKFLGAFLGFMLTMGGFIVHWTIEYYKIQSTVTKLCETEGGIKIYITPEEWRKRIGENEWKKLIPLTDFQIRNIQPPKKNIYFKGKEYKYTKGIYRAGNLENVRIKLFNSYDSSISNTIINRSIVVDIETNKILIYANYINTGAGTISNSLSGLKFWMSNLPKCPKNYYRNYYDLVKQYSYLGEKNEQ